MAPGLLRVLILFIMEAAVSIAWPQNGLGGVLVAPTRHREKLGCLFMGFVGSSCACSGIVGFGLIGSDRWITRELEGSQGRIVRSREDI